MFDTKNRKYHGQKVEIYLKDSQYSVIAELASIHGMTIDEYILVLIKNGYEYYRRGEVFLSNALRNGDLDNENFSWLYKLHAALMKNHISENGEYKKNIDSTYITDLRKAFEILKGKDKDEWVRVLKAIRDGGLPLELEDYEDIRITSRNTPLGNQISKKVGFLKQKNYEFMLNNEDLEYDAE